MLANLTIYEKDNGLLEPQYQLHMHPIDKKYVRENHYSYQYLRLYETDDGT